MSVKNLYHATETNDDFSSGRGQVEEMFNDGKKLDFIKKLPRKILSKIKSFIKRNALVVSAQRLPDKRPIYRCCESCLKAYLIHETEKLRSGNGMRRLLDRTFECETGHHGYYLDNGRLIRV